MRRNLMFVVLVVVCALFAANLAMAASDTLNVTATVAQSCTISAVTAVAFGAYDPTSASPKTAEGSLSFVCVKGTSYKTYIAGTREMTGSGGTLPFGLYTSNAYGTEFPSEAPAEGVSAANLNPITTTVYGRIPAGQDVGAGLDYTVALTATVDY